MELFKAHLFSGAVGREGRSKQITLACARSIWPHWVYPHSRHVCFPCLHCLGSRLLCRELSEACPGLYALPRSKPLRFRYLGSPQRRRLVWACILCPFQVGCCNLSLPPSLSLGFLSVQPAQLLRWMLTAQNPKKSWLATKPACSLVDNASVGP